MPTDKPRFSITMDEDLLEKVNEHQHDNKFSTQTKAIIDLVRKGLDSEEFQDALAHKKLEIENASGLADADPEARTKTRIELFTKALSKAGMLDKDQNLANEDLEFLSGMLLAINAHFKQRKHNGE